ncbi:PhoB family transcriptional regulator [Alkalihalobacillus trypoxylicola]|uniref:PhoB family transcriptional regulator n=1 Tax=Alkalihalobacillus trypoxylicola TaxID=519424 RepID=A0A161PCD4_9BACI|nr:response regulator transcription factor [Alkalihalobacillus trypoxylicola]KYG29549.1 PhoB family transcriptional regulator [Alkalihalobacillus trypoxylicola]
MKETILIVEDEQILREVLVDYFLNENFNVLEAKDGKRALELFDEHKVDLIILDIMLPKLDGWSVCRRIRKHGAVPIIMLTARSDEEDTLLGFELGADDYVTKPYSPPILLARAKRLLQNYNQKGAGHEQLVSMNGLSIDFAAREVKVEDTIVKLTNTEFEILSYLVQNIGIVITREQLIIKIWGHEYIGDDRTINTHIRNLRSKLGEKAGMIKTMVRQGYKFEDLS